MLLTKTNSKLNKTSKLTKKVIYTFNLPSLLTCPNAGICKKYCYAGKANFIFKAVKHKHFINYATTKSIHFIDLISYELDKLKPSHVRLHSSGDFYDKAYFIDWLIIAKKFKNIVFYGYTKEVKLFKSYKKYLPKNFRFTFSYGGKQDHLISSYDKKCKVFNSIEDIPKNYHIMKDNDLLILEKKNIAIIKH